MRWTALDAEARVPAFVDAAVALHRGIFDRLGAADRPFFFDYWLRRLNRATAYLLETERGPAALVTVPREGGVHEYRWDSRTLACTEALQGRLALPPGIDLERSFVMPATRDAPTARSVLAGCTAEPVQLGYVRPCGDAEPTPVAPSGWVARALEASDLEPALDLLRLSYATDADPEPDLTRQREELRQIVERDAGWSWVAVRGVSGPPLAIVSYIGMHVPLLGVPAALVADLAVRPDERGSNVARTLQRHALAGLKSAGIGWIVGNIDPDNIASRRQAEALGRSIWYEGVRFRRSASKKTGATTSVSC